MNKIFSLLFALAVSQEIFLNDEVQSRGMQALENDQPVLNATFYTDFENQNQVANTTVNGTSSWVEKAWNSTASWTKEAWNSTASWTKGAWNATSSWFTTMFSSPAQLNKKTEGFPFAESNTLTIVTGLQNAWKSTTEWLKKLFGIKFLTNDPGYKNISAEQSEAWNYINMIRLAPKYAVQDLQTLLKLNMGGEMTSYYNISGSYMETKEGNVAVEEAIRYLQKTVMQASSLSPLYWSDVLNQTSTDQANFIASSGKPTYDSKDGTSMNNRILKALQNSGTTAKIVGENQQYGPGSLGAGKFAVLRMIVNDGDPDRKQRLNLFSNSFNIAAIQIAPGMTIVDFASI